MYSLMINTFWVVQGIMGAVAVFLGLTFLVHVYTCCRDGLRVLITGTTLAAKGASVLGVAMVIANIYQLLAPILAAWYAEPLQDAIFIAADAVQPPLTDSRHISAVLGAVLSVLGCIIRRYY